MTPVEKGAFCASCKTTVKDFTKLSEKEITAFLSEKRGQKFCGRFDLSQLMPRVRAKVCLDNVPEKLSAVKRFAFAAMIVFGSSLFNIVTAQNEIVSSFSVQISAEPIDTSSVCRDELLTILRPRTDLSDADEQLVYEPPLPDTSFNSLSYTWEFTEGVHDFPFCVATGYTVILGGGVSYPWVEAAPEGPKFIDPAEVKLEPRPRHTVASAWMDEETKRQNDADEKKREAPKVKSNEDALNDSEFPRLRKRKI